MKPFIPKRFEPIAFGFLLSGLMSLIVSGIATATAIGLGDGFITKWLAAWLSSWVFAFPAVLLVAPFVRRILGAIIIQPKG